MEQIVHCGDARSVLQTLANNFVHTCVTSPPYFGLRDYDNDQQIGMETDPLVYIDALVQIFREVHRVLRKDGTLWLNIGDSYAGSGKGPEGNLGKQKQVRHVGQKHGGIVPAGMKPKDLMGIPWMLAFALRNDGWYLRQDIIWQKPHSFPESVRDRCTRAHEYLFLLSKSKVYYYDGDAIKTPSKIESGKMVNKRSVWTVAPTGYAGVHHATYPVALVKPCILAGSPIGGTVLDPFLGSGTTLVAAQDVSRNGIGIELNPDYAQIARDRVAAAPLSIFGD